MGRPMNVIDKLESWMKGAGFVDVEVKIFKVRPPPWHCAAFRSPCLLFLSPSHHVRTVC